MLHVDLNESHMKIIKLHVDINKSLFISLLEGKSMSRFKSSNMLHTIDHGC